MRFLSAALLACLSLMPVARAQIAPVEKPAHKAQYRSHTRVKVFILKYSDYNPETALKGFERDIQLWLDQHPSYVVTDKMQSVGTTSTMTTVVLTFFYTEN